LKIIIVHNFYQYTGGEDSVLQSESALLKQHGHEILLFTKDNKEILAYNFFQKVKFIQNTIYNRTIQAEFSSQIEDFKPDIVHVHNTFPLISPAIYDVCLEKRIPVIQTLHNFRLACTGALFYRENSICEECSGKKIPWHGVKYGCYRNSQLQSGVVAAMIAYHKLVKTWEKKVDCFITLTEFSKKKFLENGLPAAKLAIKPNFITPDPGERTSKGDYVLFVGRLSNEKGVINLLKAWLLIKNITLKIAGTGPLLQQIVDFVSTNNLKNVEILGFQPKSQIYSLIKNSRFLVFPSEWYEGFPLTIIESLACGVPVIGSRLGAIEEKIINNYTGLHFTPGDPQDLAAKINWAWAHPAEMAEMGKNARREYEEKYTAERNYEMLMGIYQKAVEGKRSSVF